MVEEYVVDELVTAMYDREWFIGQITDIDKDEYEVSFKKAKKKKTSSMANPNGHAVDLEIVNPQQSAHALCYRDIKKG